MPRNAQIAAAMSPTVTSGNPALPGLREQVTGHLFELAHQWSGRVVAPHPVHESPARGQLPAHRVQVHVEAARFSATSRLRRDGVEAELVITEGAPHIWQHVGSFLPEARESLARIGRHISAHIPD